MYVCTYICTDSQAAVKALVGNWNSHTLRGKTLGLRKYQHQGQVTLKPEQILGTPNWKASKEIGYSEQIDKLMKPLLSFFFTIQYQSHLCMAYKSLSTCTNKINEN